MKLLIINLCLALVSIITYAQPLRINEIMSANGGAVTDSDGDTSDWIEFFNSGTADINLNGYGLSDNKNEPYKWTFPDYCVKPGEYLIVFASDKDRKEIPTFWNTIIAQGDDWKYLVPSTEPANNWRMVNFNDADWNCGRSGFGMGDDDDATTLALTQSIFMRKKFTINNISSVRSILLHIDYDDGFVAYLNGVEIARSLMEGKGMFPPFDAQASGQHEALIYGGQPPEKFEIDNLSSILQTGENILAIQVHNSYASSVDLSAIPFLSIATLDKPVTPRIIEILNLRRNEFHTNFKLDADGESLYLTNASGVLLDSVHIADLPIDHSFGISLNDDSKWVIYNNFTPGIINSGLEWSPEMLPKPVFSMPGGIYSTGLKVSLSTPDKNDTIYYTLDGTIPSLTSSTANCEIDIPSSKVIKARILKAGKLPGDVVTNSYIIYNNNKLPVVSISMDPADLWDYNTGIYVDGPGWDAPCPHRGANYWKDWERACHLELMETTGDKVIDVDAGVKIFGNWSRENAQKSLAIYCRKEYGDDKMKYNIFSQRPYKEYKNIVLRNSGNDWNNTMFRDGLMHELTYGLKFDQQAFRPSIVFLNGEYWGIQNIREKINEYLIYQHHDVDPDNISLLENHGRIIFGNCDDYWTMYSFLENNSLASQTNYNKMLEWIDIDSFIDYYASEIYFSNHDWPGNNIRYWKTNDAAGRWSWILCDTDYSMGNGNTSVAENALGFATDSILTEWENPPWSTLMLRRLLENTKFRDQFVNRFADLLNSIYHADNVNEAIDLKSAIIEDEIGNHLSRWCRSTKDDWIYNVQLLKNFATERPSYVFGHIRQQFGFQNPCVITAQADSMKGLIKLNSLKLNKFPWKGAYFPDVSITLTAIPKVGYNFVKWTGIAAGNTSATIKVNPLSNMVVTAVFEPSGNHYEDMVINEISFNNGASTDPGDWIELYNKGTFDIDISGWMITDSDPNHQYLFADNTFLKANEYLVLSNDLTLFSSVFSLDKNLYGTFNFGLSTTSDAVKLYSQEGQLIDEIIYSNTFPWPTESLEELWSLELKNPSLDNINGSNCIYSINNGTPGARNTPYIINAIEVVTANQVELKQNYPNPFIEGTYIEIKLDKPDKYIISIMDVNGRILRTLKGDDPFSTVHTIYWDGKDESGKLVTTGIYFYRLETNGTSQIKRMVRIN